jgi:hypothetical protein
LIDLEFFKNDREVIKLIQLGENYRLVKIYIILDLMQNYCRVKFQDEVNGLIKINIFSLI